RPACPRAPGGAGRSGAASPSNRLAEEVLDPVHHRLFLAHRVTAQLGEAAQQLLLLLREVAGGGDVDLDVHHVIAAAAAVEAVDALAAQAEVAAVRGARRDLERRLAAPGGDLDQGAEDGLLIGDRQARVDVGAVAPEVLVRLDREHHVEVAGRAAVAAVLALAAE